MHTMRGSHVRSIKRLAFHKVPKPSARSTNPNQAVSPRLSLSLLNPRVLLCTSATRSECVKIGVMRHSFRSQKLQGLSKAFSSRRTGQSTIVHNTDMNHTKQLLYRRVVWRFVEAAARTPSKLTVHGKQTCSSCVSAGGGGGGVGLKATDGRHGRRVAPFSNSNAASWVFADLGLKSFWV